MPLVFIQVEQLAQDRWHIEFEGAGSSANRVASNARSFEDVVSWLVGEYAKRAGRPAPPKDIPRPIDESLLPPPPKPPVSRRNAAQRRLEADAELKKRGATRIVHRERAEDE